MNRVEFGRFDRDKIKVKYEDSILLNKWYDAAIMGINPLTKSIIYSLDELTYNEIELRFEGGGLNDDYDVRDDEIYLVARESILWLFKRLQYDQDCIIPTLFDEFDRSYIATDVNASGANSNSSFADGETMFGVILDTVTHPKQFTYLQIMVIVNQNKAPYLRWFDLKRFDPDDVFELIPRHLIPFEEGKITILRTVVKLVNEPEWLGFQDLTLEQWEDL